MFRLLPLTIVILAVAVRGQDFEHISIGPQSDPLSVIPAFVNVDQGTFVTLQFGPGRHSIRQSTFEDPCTFGGGFWSWNYTTSDPDSFVILDVWQNSNDKQALYFFDAENDSCEQGMYTAWSFAINPPSEDAFNEFRDRAINGDVARSSTVASFVPITTVPEPSSTRAASSSVSSSAQTARTTCESFCYRYHYRVSNYLELFLFLYVLLKRQS
ncbi:hypothetical protein QCA50_003122 [Cerrena zonata]|uniref:Uncharacterized protein n=1 Tax=Cerrena zonata TaxID=2478898 RepID=A0AAW0GIS2_9APHY